MAAINKSEEFVAQVCQQSFLSLWSYANPKSKDTRKELCDILVACDPDVIIFSVKEIGLPGDTITDIERWRRRAIDASVKQIYGAERCVSGMSHVIRNDGSNGLALPGVPNRKIHRVAVALGGKGKTPIKFGDFGKGFVHVFDEVSFQIVMSELDTVTDFVEYLDAKEELYKSGVKTIFNGGEEDLLAFYLQQGKKFPKNINICIVEGDIWESFITKPEYRAKKNADVDSYVWDRIVESLSADILNGRMEFGGDLTQSELAVRVMARETRFGRRALGKSFMEFYESASMKKIGARMMPGLSGVIYVFLAMPHGTDREFRVAELGGRCFVARGLNRDCHTVIGLATEQYVRGKGFSFDVIYLHMPEWTAANQTEMEYSQKEFGYFKNPILHLIHGNEYPQTDGGAV